MIVDSGNSFDLSLGVQTRTPEAGDAQVIIPPIIMPVALSLRPHTHDVPNNVAQRQSILVTQAQLRVNQAALTSTIITLAKGLWELEMVMATQFNYSGAVGTLNGVHLQILFPGPTAIDILARIAQIGTFGDYNRMRLLLTEDVSLQLVTDITGVGQNADARTTINCIRIL